MRRVPGDLPDCLRRRCADDCRGISRMELNSGMLGLHGLHDFSGHVLGVGLLDELGEDAFEGWEAGEGW